MAVSSTTKDLKLSSTKEIGDLFRQLDDVDEAEDRSLDDDVLCVERRVCFGSCCERRLSLCLSGFGVGASSRVGVKGDFAEDLRSGWDSRILSVDVLLRSVEGPTDAKLACRDNPER